MFPSCSVLAGPAALRRWSGFLVCALALTTPSVAQTLEVVSEFTRISPDGEVLRPDRGETPREILSPAIPRNGHTTLRLVLRAAPGTHYTLHIGQNPENAVRATLTREEYAVQGLEFVAGKSYPVPLPYHGEVKASPSRAEGTVTDTFLLDMWVERNAPVQRIKVEPQVQVGERWIIYPMEVRVISAVIPERVDFVPGLPTRAGLAADVGARLAWRRHLCGQAADRNYANADPHALQLVRRNAEQDVSLARSLERRFGKATITSEFLKLAHVPSVEAWCAMHLTGDPRGPEWYLRMRDWLYRRASAPGP